MSRGNTALARELTTIQKIVTSGSPPDRQEWQNALKAYQDELDQLREQFPSEVRAAITYLTQRELALTLRLLLDQLRSESESLHKPHRKSAAKE